MSESLSITELAEQVGMTVRNIRAYQSKGLLFPPEIRGRVAHYNAAHIARLELIASLQREGFTLAAIRRLIEQPGSYASIVADRRRRFRDGSSDIVASVPVPEQIIREALPDLPADLTETGLVWREDDQLVTHTVLVGVGRTLASRGVPVELVAEMQLEAASTAGRLGRAFRDRLAADQEAAGIRDPQLAADLAKVAVQLAAAAFEIAFLRAAAPDADGP